mgnify:CR=1 FL=1|jgi:hypothetical protein|tara:strand:- start:12 stop:506 length:495 start_codon:yes stop_codon:yes gene_type:complete
MEPVEQQQQPVQPIYWDRHRARFNLTLILAFGFVFLGSGFMGGFEPLVMLFGLSVAVYTWLTTPKQYLIYANALVVTYGRPRTKVVMFSDISHPELLVTPIGERLRVRLASGRRMMILVREPEEFRDRLEEALRDYNGSVQNGEVVEGTVEEIVEEDQDGPPTN